MYMNSYMIFQLPCDLYEIHTVSHIRGLSVYFIIFNLSMKLKGKVSNLVCDVYQVMMSFYSTRNQYNIK